MKEFYKIVGMLEKLEMDFSWDTTRTHVGMAERLVFKIEEKDRREKVLKLLEEKGFIKDNTTIHSYHMGNRSVRNKNPDNVLEVYKPVCEIDYIDEEKKRMNFIVKQGRVFFFENSKSDETINRFSKEYLLPVLEEVFESSCLKQVEYNLKNYKDNLTFFNDGDFYGNSI